MNTDKFCLVITLSKPWENYHREQFIKNIANVIKDKGGYILCIEPTIVSIFNLINYPKRIFNWLLGRYKLRKIDNNLYVTHAKTIEHILASVRFPLLSKLNSVLIKKQIFQIINVLDKKIKNIIIVVHRPELVFMVGKLDEVGAIYDCCDDHCLTSSLNKMKVIGNKDREKALSKGCSFIITTSEKLYKRNKSYNDSTYLIENGYTPFISDQSKSYDDSIIKSIKQPIIGYIGNIRNWMDFELLEYLFQLHKNWSFLFIGAIEKNSESIFSSYLKKYENVYLTGRVRYQDYPLIIKYVKVGIIPFKPNEFMESVNPNKFYEMLGLNLPIVSSNIGDIESKYSNICKVAHVKEEFSKHIEDIINLSESELLELRKRISVEAGYHTWQDRAKQFYGLMKHHSLVN